MSFVAGFYTFFIELNDTEKGIYDNIKQRSFRHIDEEADFFFARHLAYCHSYTEGLELLADASNPSSPIFKRTNPSLVTDILGYLGSVDVKDIRHSRKSSRHTKTIVYFFSSEQIDRFCHHLRGATENWVEGVEFYFLDAKILNWLTDHDSTRAYWNLTITDRSSIYLTIQTPTPSTFASEITMIDIWQEYQKILQRDK
jgi:uncharacterized protein YaeQ